MIQNIAAIVNQPRAMVEHVLDATKERQTIYSLLRDQGESIKTAMQTRLEDFLAKLRPLFELVSDEQVIKTVRSAIDRGEIYRSVIAGFSQGVVTPSTPKEAAEILARCPATSAFVRAYLAHAISLFESNVQKLRHGKAEIAAGKHSDFGDMLHAAYAPYCDIFRCDGRFGALLKQNAALRGNIADKRQLLAKQLNRPVAQVGAA